MDQEILQMAIDAITQEIQTDKTNARLYKERGRLRMMAGDKAGAMEDLRESSRLDPTLLDGLNGKFSS